MRQPQEEKQLHESPVDATSILVAIKRALAAPSLLAIADARAAAERGGRRLGDRRAALAAQRALHVRQTGVFDEATAQAVARRQRTLGLAPVDGNLGDAVFYSLLTSLVRDRALDAVLALVVGYAFAPGEPCIDASVDTSLYEEDYELRRLGAGPAAVAFSPAVFTRPPPRIVRCVARAREDARLRRQDTSAPVRSFLLQFLETAIADSANEGFVPFMGEVALVVDRFGELSRKEQRAARPRLEQIRGKVRERWLSATDGERRIFQSIKDALDRVEPS